MYNRTYEKLTHTITAKVQKKLIKSVKRITYK